MKHKWLTCNAFICGMVLRCAGILKPVLSLDRPVTADLTITVVHSYKFTHSINAFTHLSYS